jgi:transcriptional regulator with XRE-family HTH domain
LTQTELGARAGVSQQTISLIERGHGSKLAGDTLRRVFAALDARWEPIVTWRGGTLDRLLDEAHAALVGEIVRRLQTARWDVAVETTYSEFGERGSIDVFAARRDRRALIVVEVKSDLTVIEATIRKVDEKERIVRRSLGRERFGFSPGIVGRILVLPATDTARRRVRRASAVLDVAFPARGSEIRRWLADPRGDLSGILFVADTNRGSDTRGSGGSQRVRTAGPRSPSAGSSRSDAVGRRIPRVTPPGLVFA